MLADANGQPHSVDIAVGYFYLSGFAQVADLLAIRPGKVRILIGRTDRPTLAEIAAGYSPEEADSTAGYHAGQNRRQEADAAQATLANIGRNAAAQLQDDASEAGIKSLARLSAGGKIAVRAYLKDRMHAKAYIGYTGRAATPGTAIIGSTNFSAAGFAGNTELNYPVTHPTAAMSPQSATGLNASGRMANPSATRQWNSSRPAGPWPFPTPT